MTLAYQNTRLQELAAVADLNRAFFEDFEQFIIGRGYESLFAFVSEENYSATFYAILAYLNRDLPPNIDLYDGIARPYPPRNAKWLFLGWLFRDAPVQRLNPMVKSMRGKTVSERRAHLLNLVREGLASSFPGSVYWRWETVREVMIDRLEGSRRAIKGTLFETLVRETLRDIIDEKGYGIEVSRTQVALEGETFDVSVRGVVGTVLMPVKTRETMGGGHALLFTRDIHKSITAAHSAGFTCVPIVIAESWSGDLESLGCEKIVYLNMNPNRVALVREALRNRLDECIEYISQVCLDE